MKKRSEHAAVQQYEHNRCRIAAIGMINALGENCPAIFEALSAGDVSKLQLDATLVPGTAVLAGKVSRHLQALPKELERFDFRNSRLVQAAFQQVAAETKEVIRRFGAERVAVIMGSSTAGIAVNEHTVLCMKHEGAAPDIHAALYQEMRSVSEVLARLSGAKGPCYTISTACSSSTKVFATARRLFAAGLCDAALVGGADTLSKLTVNGFHSLGLLSQEPSRPFSVNRDGIVIGEGAAVLLLTAEEGGTQVMGVGESSDAYHFSAPDPQGDGAEAAMRGGLSEAGISPEDIWYINLHGTGTPPNDKMEAEAIARVFSPEVLCSSSKPFFGHLLGASGATELAVSALFIEREAETIPLPPHHWDAAIDPELPPLRFVEQGAAYQRPELVYWMSNSFAFGGSNASVVCATGPR